MNDVRHEFTLRRVADAAAPDRELEQRGESVVDQRGVLGAALTTA
jgi:hypothetical protein